MHYVNPECAVLLCAVPCKIDDESKKLWVALRVNCLWVAAANARDGIHHRPIHHRRTT